MCRLVVSLMVEAGGNGDVVAEMFVAPGDT